MGIPSSPLPALVLVPLLVSPPLELSEVLKVPLWLVLLLPLLVSPDLLPLCLLVVASVVVPLLVSSLVPLLVVSSCWVLPVLLLVPSLLVLWLLLAVVMTPVPLPNLALVNADLCAKLFVVSSVVWT